jgi:hypothetical protein
MRLSISPYFFFPHRFAAAFAAIRERLRGPNAAALAAPPFNPPRRPNATAWGFFAGSTGFLLARVVLRDLPCCFLDDTKT